MLKFKFDENKTNKILSIEWDYIIYHGKCADGISSAWCICKYMKVKETLKKNEKSLNDMLSKRTYTEILSEMKSQKYPINLYEEKNGINVPTYEKPKCYPSPPMKFPYKLNDVSMKNKNVLVLDMCLPKKICQKLVQECNNFMIIDHHKSSWDELGDENYLIYCEADKKLSAVGMISQILSFDYQILNYISDRDTWNWKLPYSKEINKYLQSNSHLENIESFENFYCNYWLKKYQNPKIIPNEIIENGKLLINHEYQQIKYISNNAKIVQMNLFDKHIQICIVNTPIYQSDISEYLFKNQEIFTKKIQTKINYNIVICYHFVNPSIGTLCNFSVRSQDNSDSINALQIAKIFNGGGHKYASGFRTLSENFFNKTSPLQTQNSNAKIHKKRKKLEYMILSSATILLILILLSHFSIVSFFY